MSRYVCSISFAIIAMVTPVAAQGLGTVCAPNLGCMQISCDLFRVAAAHASQDQRSAFMAQATPAQRAAGQKCLGQSSATPARFRAGGKKLKR